MFTLQISTEIHIEADAKVIWSILTDLSHYHEWNPFIQKISGRLALDEHLHIEIHPEHQKPMSFKPRIIALHQNQQFGWLGRFILPYFMDGEHRFEIQSSTEGTCRFIHTETFKGLLVPFIAKQLTKIEHDFNKMNQALKVKAESA